jgi:hypothetical protein
MIYSAVSKDDYQKALKISRGHKVLCYSASQFEAYRKRGDPEVIGEALHRNKKEEIARLSAAGEELTVSAYHGHSRLLYREAGFLCVGEDQYVALLKSRLPFFLWLLLAMLLVIGIVALVSWYLTDHTPVPTPYNPLPVEDSRSEPLEDGLDTATSPQDGGAVSLSYSLDADLSLSSGEIGIYTSQPDYSNIQANFTTVDANTDTETDITADGLSLSAGSTASAKVWLSGDVYFEQLPESFVPGTCTISFETIISK